MKVLREGGALGCAPWDGRCVGRGAHRGRRLHGRGRPNGDQPARPGSGVQTARHFGVGQSFSGSGAWWMRFSTTTRPGAFGLFENQVTVLLHTGSRGLGYQVCDDSLAFMNKHVKTLGIQLPDRQLACAMIRSAGRCERYLAAHGLRGQTMPGPTARSCCTRARENLPGGDGYRTKRIWPCTKYMTSRHNIAKRETHIVDGKPRVVCVHRKGATRAFAPGHPAICDAYRQVGAADPDSRRHGHRLLCPGRHPAGHGGKLWFHLPTAPGRVLSRTAAKKQSRGRAIHRELADKGILVRWTGPQHPWPRRCPTPIRTSISVVESVHGAGISKESGEAQAHLRDQGMTCFIP